jgi:hypothetical protein
LVKGSPFSPLFWAAAAELALKRKLAFPVSRNMTTMGQAFDESRRHLGVAEDTGPFAEAEVGGDHHAGPLVELAQQMGEQKRSA